MAKKSTENAVEPLRRAERIAPFLAKAYAPMLPERDYDFGDFLDEVEAVAKQMLGECGTEKSPYTPPPQATAKQLREVAAARHVLSRITMLDRALASGDILTIALTAVEPGRALRTEEVLSEGVQALVPWLAVHTGSGQIREAAVAISTVRSYRR